MSDLISRADAINAFWEDSDIRTAEVRATLKALPSAEAEPKRVLQGYCEGTNCKWWNPQVEGCNRCVMIQDEYTHTSADAEFADLPDIPRAYYEKIVGNMSHEINMLKEQLESADAVQGEWKFVDDEIFAGEYFCSICGKRAEVDLYGEWILSNFCPSCGSRMKGGGE